MRLYFTGAQSYLSKQNSSALSLGGYPSSSQLPVEGIDKLFGSISQQDLLQGGTSVKAVVLQNNTDAEIAGGEIFYKNTSQFPISSYRVALVALTYDPTCDEYSMEKISNPLDKPLHAMFVDCNGEENSLSLPSIPINRYVGIWIERRINAIKGKESLSDDFLLNAFNVEKINHVAQYKFVSNAVGQYFTLDTLENQYVIWFDDGSGIFPQLAGNYELVIVKGVSEFDSLADVALKVANKISTIIESRGEVATLLAGNAITITNNKPGKVQPATVSSSDIEYQVVTEGLSDSVENLEAVELIIEY